MTGEVQQKTGMDYGLGGSVRDPNDDDDGDDDEDDDVENVK